MKNKYSILLLVIFLWQISLTSHAQCPGNILQNSQFTNGLSNWMTFSGYVPPPVPNNLGCLSTFAVLRAYNDTTQSPSMYGDGLSQFVVIDSGKCYNLCLCMAMPVGILYGDDVQFWAATNDPGVTYQSLVNNTYPAGSASLIGVIQVSSNTPQQYCIHNWYAHKDFTRLIIINSTVNDVATVLIDNICMEENLNCNACVNTSISANFSASSNGTLTQFSDLSTTNQGTIIGWEWKFNDPGNPLNDTSSQQNPLYNFSAGGVYIVCLKVYVSVPTPDGIGQSICVDSTCFCVMVSGFPPVLDCDTTGMNNGFAFNASNLTASFFGSSNAAFAWTWDFGDPNSGSNNSSNLQNPVHTFSSPGIYTVCLILSYPGNAGIVCRDTICKDVNVMATGIDLHERSNLVYFPNPVKDKLQLDIEGMLLFRVFDTRGKLVLSGMRQNAVDTIDLSPLQRGMYFMEIQAGEAKREIIKLIKH